MKLIFGIFRHAPSLGRSGYISSSSEDQETLNNEWGRMAQQLSDFIEKHCSGKEDGYQIIKSDTAEFKGFIVNQKPEYGEITFANDTFHGYFKNGRPHYLGYVKTPGMKLHGCFIDGHPEGYCRFKLGDASTERVWIKDKDKNSESEELDYQGINVIEPLQKFFDKIGPLNDGHHTITNSFGSYTGTIENNNPTNGTLILREFTYEGLFVNKLPHGEGTYRSPYLVYKGNFAFGKACGQGTSISLYGNKHIGMWENNSRQGQGKLYSASGDRYDGNWENDKRHGEGKYTLHGGGEAGGTWQNNELRDGWYTFPNGYHYKGQLNNGQPHGFGEMFYSRDLKYKGNWVNGKKEGPGKLIYSNGEVFDGLWKDDKKEGPGKLIDPNGVVFDGVWKDDKKEGAGKLIYSNSEAFHGVWQNDTLVEAATKRHSDDKDNASCGTNKPAEKKLKM